MLCFKLLYLNCLQYIFKNLVSLPPLHFRFTPDFTASRVIRELKFITASGSEFVFVLNASLPYHMLATCAEALPRPNWELALYIIISGIMRYLCLLSRLGCMYHLTLLITAPPGCQALLLIAGHPPNGQKRQHSLVRLTYTSGSSQT